MPLSHIQSRARLLSISSSSLSSLTFVQPPSVLSLSLHHAAAITTFLPFHRTATVRTLKTPSRSHAAADTSSVPLQPLSHSKALHHYSLSWSLGVSVSLLHALLKASSSV
ncbi:uncharacterized protein DS421_11g327420 [Arachis hypogaea]|nr:uncharacterized protein DS421_11g327420 [Arachis hypogaea]